MTMLIIVAVILFMFFPKIFWFSVVGVAIFWGLSYYRSQSYEKRCKDYLSQINNQTVSIPDIEPSPIRLGNNEKLFAIYQNVQKGTYKSDGRVAYGGIGARFRIAKGISIGGASGRVARGQSWVFDETGTLYITSKGLRFDGSFNNEFIPYNKTSTIGCDGLSMYVNKTTGKDVCFKASGEFSPQHAVLVYGLSTNQIENA